MHGTGTKISIKNTAPSFRSPSICCL